MSAIAVHAFLNASEPRFCPWCLIVATTCAACAFATVPQQGTVTTFRTPRALRLGFVPLALGVLGMHLASGTGRYDPLLPGVAPTFDEASVADLPAFTPGVPWDARSPRVTLVTLPWCAYCKQAKSTLAREGVPFRELAPCSYVQRSGCFDTRGKAVHVPLVFATDERHQTRFMQVGWTSDSVVRDLRAALSRREAASRSK